MYNKYTFFIRII